MAIEPPKSTQQPPERSDFLDELAVVLAGSLAHESGIEPGEAQVLVERMVRRVAEEFGGCKFYVPKRKSDQVELMRQVIGREWNRTNTRALCRRFDISESRLRELFSEYRKANKPVGH